MQNAWYIRMKRVFLIVLDSFGIGEMPDAREFGDAGSNTLKTVSNSEYFSMPNMQRLGLFNIDGVECRSCLDDPEGSFARMTEVSKGKDTTIGHWEIAGIESSKPLPTYPNGFPEELLDKFKQETGKNIICNLPYSGTEVIKDYGKQHVETGDLIVYTSADSVFQIAAHEEVVPLEQLYECCRKARKLLAGEHGVGRVIARPFTGEYPNYKRTANRHDFSLEPPAETMLTAMQKKGLDVIGVGKINDIFAGSGITEYVYTKNNDEGIERTFQYMEKEFEGICFVNLVDFDMLYGHRNDIDGYAKALTEFDMHIPHMLNELKEDDILMITADHGCDPGTASTDHSREYTPLIIYGRKLKSGVNLGTRNSFADTAKTILDYFKIDAQTAGTSFLESIAVP